MTALDSDFAFGKMLRQPSTTDSGLRADHDAFAEGNDARIKSSGGVAAFTTFAGLGVMSAVIFTTGYLALLSDTPAIWIHRLMALTLAQSILISAVALKLLPHIERRLSVRIFAGTATEQLALPDPSETADEPPAAAPLPSPPKPVVGGKLAGREFLLHADGTIEIDTLVGRRRFVSLSAAKEFVGS
jgi:hypothetical protein